MADEQVEQCCTEHHQTCLWEAWMKNQENWTRARKAQEERWQSEYLAKSWIGRWWARITLSADYLACKSPIYTGKVR